MLNEEPKTFAKYGLFLSIFITEDTVNKSPKRLTNPPLNFTSEGLVMLNASRFVSFGFDFEIFVTFSY